MSQPGLHPAILPAMPAGSPFTVKLRLLPYVLRHSRAQLLMFVPFGVLMIVGSVVLHNSGQTTVYVRKYGIGEVPATPIVWGGIALGIWLLIGPFVTAIRQLAAGPAIGVDKTGVYIRPSLDMKRTQFLPWDQIRTVSVRNMNGPNLCVCPVDSRVEDPFTVANSSTKTHFSGRSVGLMIAQHRRLKNLGTNIFVPIGGADKSPDEILDGLRQWSSGRAPISNTRAG
jgi:hypothetical protein